MKIDYEIKKENSKDNILTLRQLEYLSLVSLGLNNIEISNILIISLNTVKMTLKVIFEKLKVNNRTSAITYSFIQGILTLDIIEYVIEKYDLKDKLPIRRI